MSEIQTEPVVDLDARGLETRIEAADEPNEDDDRVLILDDGDVAIRITTGAGGSMYDAMTNLQMLSTRALQLVELLRRRSFPNQAHQLGPFNGPGAD